MILSGIFKREQTKKLTLIFTKKPEKRKLNSITIVATKMLMLKLVVKSAPIRKPMPREKRFY